MPRSWTLLLATVSYLGGTAIAADYRVGIGDDCLAPTGCFSPAALTIDVGDSVTFFGYAEIMSTGPHNVVADDGSFRCALGCDGEGGNGTPLDNQKAWHFTRTFNTVGTINYHDEVGHAKGVIVVADPSTFAIGPGITGAWYDPLQPGHGLMIEVLTGNRIYVSWLAYGPDASQDQTWITGAGTYAGNRARISPMFRPVGGHAFPISESAQIEMGAWGTLELVFSDCNHGGVTFDATRTGYGSGGLNITRLTQPAGLTC